MTSYIYVNLLLTDQGRPELPSKKEEVVIELENYCETLGAEYISPRYRSIQVSPADEFCLLALKPDMPMDEYLLPFIEHLRDEGTIYGYTVTTHTAPLAVEEKGTVKEEVA